MSIIYEALKKIEAGGHKSSEIKIGVKPKANPKLYLLFALVICLGFLLANFVFHLFSQPALIKATPLKTSEVKEIAKVQPLPQETPVSVNAPSLSPPVEKQINASTFTLNGIFFSENEGYAIINNQIVKTGDFIEGLKVARIDENEVELESEGSTVKLKMNR